MSQAAVKKAERDLGQRQAQPELDRDPLGGRRLRPGSIGQPRQPGRAGHRPRSSRSGPDYVWVDANYKETQLHHIKIGMPVDLYVDAYPGQGVQGAGLGLQLPGTGLSESLLPPENATGNYIKVTQRLPVRIELVEPNPPETPLFIGLSVVPYVKHQEQP